MERILTRDILIRLGKVSEIEIICQHFWMRYYEFVVLQLRRGSRQHHTFVLLDDHPVRTEQILEKTLISFW